MKKQKTFEQIASTVYMKTENIVSRSILDETLLVPISGNLADMQCIFSTESVGAFIWDNIDGGNDLETIHALILDEFEVDTDNSMSDLHEFITTLHDAGLIQEVEN